MDQKNKMNEKQYQIRKQDFLYIIGNKILENSEFVKTRVEQFTHMHIFSAIKL